MAWFQRSGLEVEDNRQRDLQSGSRPERNLMRYAGMGVELAAGIVGLTLVGLWIDYRWKCGPTGVLIGAGLGIVGGLYNFIRQALALSRSELKDRPRAHRGDHDE
jgi:F0F1-type ATP synthase assembly protein I